MDYTKKNGVLVPKQRLFAPMLSTFGGGSARGFNPGGGSSFADYTLVVYSGASVSTTRSDFSSTTNTNYSFSGYATGPTSINVTESGGELYSAVQHQTSGVYSAKVSVTENLGTREFNVRGCRGGNHAAVGGYGPSNGGDGLNITCDLDLGSLFSVLGSFDLYFLLGHRGIDITASATNNGGTAASGGGSTVVAAYASSTWYPMIIASGGGGGYQDDRSSRTHKRAGLNAFMPPSSSYTSYYGHTQYPNSTYELKSSYTDSVRPWSSEEPSGTGSGQGTSWDQVGVGYDYPGGTDSYAATVPSLKQYLNSIFSSTYTPWDISDPTGSDSFTQTTTFSSWGGGNGGAYGGGGGSGYYGGVHGDYETDNGYPNNYGSVTNRGRARGGQGFINSTYCSNLSTTNGPYSVGYVSMGAQQ